MNHWLTTSNQEMLAHLKKITIFLSRLPAQFLLPLNHNFFLPQNSIWYCFLFLFATKQNLILFLNFFYHRTVFDVVFIFARQIHFIDSSDEDEEYLLQLQELQWYFTNHIDQQLKNSEMRRYTLYTLMYGGDLDEKERQQLSRFPKLLYISSRRPGTMCDWGEIIDH